MQIIKKTIEAMEATLDDAEKYAKMAVECKEDHEEIARIYEDTSVNHMDTYKKLHAEVSDLIRRYRSEKGEAPEHMRTIYEWEHEKAVKRMEDIKRLHEIYKEL